MFLKKISLLNFKNIEQAELALCRGVNCLVGDNGAGKTNVIDAVYYLSMCKSSLPMTDGQSIRHGADFFLAEGQYLTDGGKSENIVCSFSRKGGKVLKRNGKEYERLSDHVGLVPAVIVMRYNAVLAERNRLLKNMPDETMLQIYDMQLVEQGERIHARRREFAERLQPVAAEYYRILSGDREQVGLHYKSELNDRPFGEILLAARQKDLVNEFTTSGIHRDDLVLRIGGYPLRKYGSQGQQKSFLIALKLAQYTIVAQEKGEKPILLLDDLFDKLDAGRVEQLIRLVSEDSFGQIVITDCNPTRLRRILDKAGGAYSLFTVENGGIGQETATAGVPACGGQLPAEERAKEAADQTRHAGPQEAGAAEGIRTAAVQGEVSEDLRNAASAGEKSGGKDARGTDTADTASGGKEGAR